MKLEIKDGKLNIDVLELLENLTPEDRGEVAESLCIVDDVILRVADQIIKGWTEAGSHGSNDSHNPVPLCALGKAVRAVALASGDIAAKQINDLVETLVRREAYHELESKWAWEMHGMLMRPPPPPDAYDTSKDEYEVVKKAKQ
jgi:hypothetical protein